MTDQEIYDKFQGKVLFKSNLANTQSKPTELGIELLKIISEQGGKDSCGRPWSDYFGFPSKYEIPETIW